MTPDPSHLTPSPDDPTPEELDLIEEKTTGKPVDKGGALANRDAIQQRITLLESQSEKIKAHRNSGKLSKPYAQRELDLIDKDLADARQLLVMYEAQHEGRN